MSKPWKPVLKRKRTKARLKRKKMALKKQLKEAKSKK